jgi:hypothetical protein
MDALMRSVGAHITVKEAVFYKEYQDDYSGFPMPHQHGMAETVFHRAKDFPASFWLPSRDYRAQLASRSFNMTKGANFK